MSAHRLELRRGFGVGPERLFDAWTQPEHLLRWWGPRDVRCTHAEVDLREGGGYRIDNQLPGGETVTIVGRYLTVERPHLLIYTWSTDEAADLEEKVTVRFEPTATGCDVIVLHERVQDLRIVELHRSGWLQCLDGLQDYAEGNAS